MALLSFPPFPINGELYPLSPVPGQNQYEWVALDQTWKLVGRSTGVTAGTYGDSGHIPQFTVNSSGAITFVQDVPIAIANTSNVGVVKPDGTTITIAVDGTLSAVPGPGGTVTSVAVNGGSTGLTFAGSPVTTSGTFTLGGVLGIGFGGTGATSAFGARAAIGAGTVTMISTGAGISGGPITSSGSVSLTPATTAAIGGVIPDGTTITVLPNGTISATVEMVAAPSDSSSGGAAGQIAVSTGYFYWFDGTQWLRVAGSTF